MYFYEKNLKSLEFDAGEIFGLSKYVQEREKMMILVGSLMKNEEE